MKLNVIYCLAFLGFISCRPTRDISFEILSPAKLSLPAPDAPVLLLNCSYLPQFVRDSSNALSMVSPPEVYQIDSIITKNLFDGLFSVLNESPSEILKNAGYLEMRTDDTTGFLYSLSPETVTGLCRENNVKYIAALEYYSFNQNYDYYYDPGNNEYVFLKHRQSILWRIYSDSGELIDEYISEDTLYSDYSSQLKVDYLNITSGIYIEYDLISNGFFEAGINYGLRLSPSWMKVYRFLYEMKEKTASGRKRITEDKERLMAMSTSGHKEKAYKACFNLAVLSESGNEIPAALEWTGRALQHKRTIPAIKYNTFLKKRLTEIGILDKQTGKINR